MVILKLLKLAKPVEEHLVYLSKQCLYFPRRAETESLPGKHVLILHKGQIRNDYSDLQYGYFASLKATVLSRWFSFMLSWDISLQAFLYMFIILKACDYEKHFKASHKKTVRTLG